MAEEGGPTASDTNRALLKQARKGNGLVLNKSRARALFSRTIFIAFCFLLPAVVIYNTDGKIGRYEHRIKVACERAGVAFYSVP